MTVERTRWTDDRLDDLATLVRSNDARTDRLNDLVEAHDRDIKQISRTGDRRSNNSFQLWLVLLAIFGTAILNVCVILATAH